MTKVIQKTEKVNLNTKYGKWCCPAMKSEIANGYTKIKHDKFYSKGEMMPYYSMCPYCKTEVSINTKAYLRKISSMYTERASKK